MFFQRQILTLVLTTVLTGLSAWALSMWNPMYILLLWTLIMRSLETLIPHSARKLNVAGSTVAHVGFGLIIAGALVSNANKDIISQNKTSFTKNFANENLLIHQGDTVQMGDYWVSWTGQEEEGYYLNYVPEFFEEQVTNWFQHLI